MSADTVRVLLVLVAIYMIFKTATAPKRGTFLTLFGNIQSDTQPQAFKACLIGGYLLAATLFLAAVFSDAWLPI
jgi:hypothetical protein